MANPCIAVLSRRIESAGTSIFKAKTFRKRREIGWRLRTVESLKKVFFLGAQEFNCSLLVECGAHDGEISKIFTRGEDNYAIAIEANPNTFAEKTMLAAGPRVRVMNYALTNRDETVHLLIPTHEGILTPGNASILKNSDMTSHISLVVEGKMLDSIVSESDLHSHSVLWVDVEGMSLPLLQGATNFLSTGNCKMILVEVETDQIWNNQALDHDVDEYLQQLGYLALLRDAQTKSQFNMVYVLEKDLNYWINISADFWTDIASIRLKNRDIFPLSIRDFLRILKIRLLKNQTGFLGKMIHRLAAIFGSKSSVERLRTL